MTSLPHEHWMRIALEEARLGAEEREVPIGAVAVLDDRLLARDHNRCRQFNDPTAHAEILALRAAGEVLNNYRLLGVDLYVTVEPCPMCAGALIWARVRRLVYGARDAKAGAVVSKARLLEAGLFNHDVEVCGEVLADECAEILRAFFAERRALSAEAQPQ